ncbi:MAG: phosphoenolpyruvate--protein phosphotransferase [Treponema sp.]|jgi:phosphotransferase system enzyme I (PtsI)|nr:phosphoenolpyruvate--protein phosphotransferase [Treponema sp.]
MKILTGISAGAGVVIGKALVVQENRPEIPRYAIDPGETPAELARFVTAAREAAEELRTLKKNSAGLGWEQGAILDAHLMMVEDPDFHYQIKARLESKYDNIEWMVFEVARDLSHKLVQSPDAYLRERAVDVADVSRRIINRLLGITPFSLADLREDVILAAHNLSLSDALTMNRERVKALVMDTGSRISHTAIIIRAFGIPSVLGLSTAVREITSGDTLIVDGEQGQVILDPDKATLRCFKEKLANRKRGFGEFVPPRDSPAETTDGRRVSLKANIGVPGEAESVHHYGAEGIGLYRSEFLFLQDGHGSEEQQYRAYSRVVKAMAGKPVTIRTIDIGGDKVMPGMRVPEENPLLGWRAVRFSLTLPEFFKTQLRAILRSSAEGPVRIMFPMISGVEELEEALTILEEAKEECRGKGQAFSADIEAGTMIEIPGAVMTADILAEKSAFFSIGTNDLIQYSLAVDRGNEKVSYLAQPSHPAVPRFIKRTIDAAHKRGIPAALCGELAGDPAAAALLLGLGLDEFSMTAAAIPQVKRVIRGTDYESCRVLAEQVLAASSCREVQALVSGWNAERFPGLEPSSLYAGMDRPRAGNGGSHGI